MRNTQGNIDDLAMDVVGTAADILGQERPAHRCVMVETANHVFYIMALGDDVIPTLTTHCKQESLSTATAPLTLHRRQPRRT